MLSVLCVVPLAIAGVHLVTQVAAALVLGAAYIIAPSNRVAKPVWVMLGLAGYSAFQAIPLPRGFVAAISPAASATWAGALRPFGVGELGWVSLSLDPAASWIEANKWLSYALALSLFSGFASRRRGATPLKWVFGASSAVALVTLVHWVFHLDSVYGFYQPRFAVQASNIGPLLNPNNLSGVMNLGSLVGLGFLVSSRRQLHPIVASIGVALCVGVLGIAASRAGMATWLVGSLLLLVVSPRRQRPRQRVLAIGALVVGVAFAAAGLRRQGINQILTDGSQKVSIQLWTLDLVRTYWPVGVGRGAFAEAFPPFRSFSGGISFQNPENFVLQWISEWGIPVGVLVSVLFVWWLVRLGRRSWRETLRFGAFCGILAVTLQNLGDLGFEVPGLVLLVLATIAALPGGRSGKDSERKLKPLALALGVSVALVVALGLKPVTAERDELFVLARDASQPREVVMQRIRKAMRWRPAEAYFPLLAAGITARDSDAQSLRFVSRSLELDPMSGDPHLLLAKILARRRATGQAVLEVRLAAERDEALHDDCVALTADLIKAGGDWRRAVPDSALGAKFLHKLAPTQSEISVRIEMLRVAVQRDPQFAPARFALGGRLLDATENREKPCKTPCVEEVERQLEALRGLDGDPWAVVSLRVRLLRIGGKLGEAQALLKTECGRLANQNCERARLEVALALDDEAGAQAATDSLVSLACSREGCGATTDWAAGVLSEPYPGLSLKTRLRGAEADPAPNRWLAVGRQALAQGQLSLARRAATRAQELGAGAPAKNLAERVEQARTRRLRGTLH